MIIQNSPCNQDELTEEYSHHASLLQEDIGSDSDSSTIVYDDYEARSSVLLFGSSKSLLG
jgi:hypothetical protein